MSSFSAFLDPTQAIPPTSSSTSVLCEDDVVSWKEKGFCVVNGVIEETLLEHVASLAHDFYAMDKVKGVRADFGAVDYQEMVFPSLDPKHADINALVLNERLIDACSQLLQCSATDLRLSQAELWCKSGSAQVDRTDAYSNNDQRMHIDGFNHYLTFPSDWYAPEAVAMIIYYDDSDVAGGETAIVARKGLDDVAYHEVNEQFPGNNFPLMLTPGGRSDLLWMNDKTIVEENFKKNNPDVYNFRVELYAREQRVKYRKGSVLFYRLDVWHRGTPINVGAIRRTHNLVYKKKGCDWINHWNNGAAKNMYTREQIVEKIVARSTMKQRALMGFPAADDAYWTPATLEAFKRRFSSVEGGLQNMGEIEEAVRHKYGDMKN